MSPIMFVETIIFQKMNEEFRDLTTVAKAMKNEFPQGTQRKI